MFDVAAAGLFQHLNVIKANVVAHSASCALLWSFVELFGQDPSIVEENLQRRLLEMEEDLEAAFAVLAGQVPPARLLIEGDAQ